MPAYKIEELVEKLRKDPEFVLAPEDSIDISNLETLLNERSIVIRDMLHFFCTSQMERNLAAKNGLAFVRAIRKIKKAFAKNASNETVKEIEAKLSKLWEKWVQEHRKSAVDPVAEKKLTAPSSMPVAVAQISPPGEVDLYTTIQDDLDRKQILPDFKIVKDAKGREFVVEGFLEGSSFLSEKPDPTPLDINLSFVLENNLSAVGPMPPNSYWLIGREADDSRLIYIDGKGDKHDADKAKVAEVVGLEVAIENFDKLQKKVALKDEMLPADKKNLQDQLLSIADIIQEKLKKERLAYYLEDRENTKWQITWHPIFKFWFATCKGISRYNYAISIDGPWCSFKAKTVSPPNVYKRVGLKVHVNCDYKAISTVFRFLLESREEAKKRGVAAAFDRFKCFARITPGVTSILEHAEQRFKTYCFYVGFDLKDLLTILDLFIRRCMDNNVPANAFSPRSDTVLKDTNNLAMVRNDMGLGLFCFRDFKTVEFVQFIDDTTNMDTLLTDQSEGVTYKIIPMYVRLASSKNHNNELIIDETMIDATSLSFRSLRSADQGAFDFSPYQLRANQAGQELHPGHKKSVFLRAPRKGPLDSPAGYFSFTRDWSVLFLKLRAPLPAAALRKQLVKHGLMTPGLHDDRQSVGEIVERYRISKRTHTTVSSTSSQASEQLTSFGAVAKRLEKKSKGAGPRLTEAGGSHLPSLPLSSPAVPGGDALPLNSAPALPSIGHTHLPHANRFNRPPALVTPTPPPTPNDELTHLPPLPMAKRPAAESSSSTSNVNKR